MNNRRECYFLYKFQNASTFTRGICIEDCFKMHKCFRKTLIKMNTMNQNCHIWGACFLLSFALSLLYWLLLIFPLTSVDILYFIISTKVCSSSFQQCHVYNVGIFHSGSASQTILKDQIHYFCFFTMCYGSILIYNNENQLLAKWNE